MDNKYLDDILILFRDKYKGSVDDRRLEKDIEQYKSIEFANALQFLKEEGLISSFSYPVGSQSVTSYSLTPKGKYFMKNGGYTANEEFKRNTLTYARKSKNYALWALITGLIAFIFSIVTYILSRK